MEEVTEEYKKEYKELYKKVMEENETKLVSFVTPSGYNFPVFFFIDALYSVDDQAILKLPDTDLEYTQGIVYPNEKLVIRVTEMILKKMEERKK